MTITEKDIGCWIITKNGRYGKIYSMHEPSTPTNYPIQIDLIGLRNEFYLPGTRLAYSVGGRVIRRPEVDASADDRDVKRFLDDLEVELLDLENLYLEVDWGL